MTQRVIAEKSGISLYTVINTMKALQEGNPAFLVKINSGAYQVNPDIVWKGSHNARMGIIFDYSDNVSAQNARRQEESTEPSTKSPEQPQLEVGDIEVSDEYYSYEEPYEKDNPFDPEYRIEQLHKRIGCITLEDFKYLSYESMEKLETDLNSGKPIGAFIKDYLDEISAFKHFERVQIQEFEAQIQEFQENE